jgi:hypothetical protein
LPPDSNGCDWGVQKFQHTTPQVSKPPETNGLHAIDVFTGSADGVQDLVAQDEGKGVGDLRQNGSGSDGILGAEAVGALNGREKVAQESVWDRKRTVHLSTRPGEKIFVGGDASWVKVKTGNNPNIPNKSGE